MFSIELKQVLKDSAIILLILAGLSVGVMTTEKDVYLGPVFEIFLLLYSAYAGWSMFARERNDGAMEYLLSLPVSRIRMVVIKLVPRALGALAMLGVYALLHGQLLLPTLVSPGDFTIFYATFFLVSLSLSICIKTFISAVFLTTILSGGLTFLNWVLNPGNSQTSICLHANVPLLLFPLLFFVMVRYYDVRPSQSFNLQFAAIGFTLAVLIAGAFYIAGGTKWTRYYITGSGDIFRTSHSLAQLVKRNGQQIKLNIPAGCHMPIEEEGSVLYIEQVDRSSGNCLPASLAKLNLDSGLSEELYKLENGWTVLFQSRQENGILKNGNLYVLLGNIHSKQYKVLQIDTKWSKELSNGSNNTGSRVVEIPISGDFHQQKIRKLVHVSLEPLRFIISTGDKLYSLDKEGNARELMDMKYVAAWKDRLLVFDDFGMTLYRLKENLPVPLMQKKNVRMMPRKWGPPAFRKVIILDSGKYYIFNMEDMTFQLIPMPFSPYYYLERGERFYIVWARVDEISVGEIRDGQLVMKKEWISAVEGFRIIQVFDSGITVNNSKEYEKYLFE